MEKPRSTRRWFQFGLRSIFVAVTLFGIWLGWQLSIVGARRAAIAEIEALNGVAYNAEGISNSTPYVPHIPFWRVWMGDEAIGCLCLPFDYADRPEESERITRLFPEVILPETWWTSPTAHLE